MSKHEQWHLTEEAAERYERYVARYILGPWAPLLVDAARLMAGDRVLDVACGTGVVTRIAAERVGPDGQIIGLDLNPGMIRVARSLPSPIGAPMEWLERSALSLGLKDESVDAVLCQQGLQFFPDKPLALREMRRVLKRGAVLRSAFGTAPGVTTARLARRSRNM
jgi:ubiquinone/menaquinone biosynthesis C-methylase UbiE